MLRGDDGNPFAIDFEAEFVETLVDRGEFVVEEIGWEVGGIKVDAPGLEALDFAFDGSGDDVSGGEFEAFVVVVHKSPSFVIAEGCASASHGFGYEEAGELGVFEGGGVELLEFHIGDGGSGCLGEGDTIPGGDSGVGCVVVDFAAPAGGEQGGFGDKLGGAEVANECVGTEAFSVADD